MQGGPECSPLGAVGGLGASGAPARVVAACGLEDRRHCSAGGETWVRKQGTPTGVVAVYGCCVRVTAAKTAEATGYWGQRVMGVWSLGTRVRVHEDCSGRDNG